MFYASRKCLALDTLSDVTLAISSLGIHSGCCSIRVLDGVIINE